MFNEENTVEQILFDTFYTSVTSNMTADKVCPCLQYTKIHRFLP